MNNNEVKMVVRVQESNGEVSVLTISDVYRAIEVREADYNVSKCGDDYQECWASRSMVSDEGVEVDVVYNAVTSYYELHVGGVEVNAGGYEIILDDEVVDIETAVSLLHIDKELEAICQELAANTEE